MIRRCRNIRTKRQATGQTVEEVSERTRIPVAHLIAIEDERLQDLPAGPYASAYLRTLETHLGLPVGTPAPAVGRT
ncbi:MAG: hypothetical protein GWP91_24725, partial [Rhodobacterales bacterium]|nr:hypothetical protein [Rhodobacterales bacterium]